MFTDSFNELPVFLRKIYRLTTRKLTKLHEVAQCLNRVDSMEKSEANPMRLPSDYQQAQAKPCVTPTTFEDIEEMRFNKDVPSLKEVLYTGDPSYQRELLDALGDIATLESIKVIIEFLNNPKTSVSPTGHGGLFDRFFHESITTNKIHELLFSQGCEVVPILVEIYWEANANKKTRTFIENILLYAEIPNNPASKWIVP